MQSAVSNQMTKVTAVHYGDQQMDVTIVNGSFNNNPARKHKTT